MEILYTFYNAVIMYISNIYIWHKLLNKKINFRDYKLYIASTGVIGLSMLNDLLNDKIIKLLFITLVFVVFFKFLFKEDLKKTIITSIFYQLIVMIAETVYAIILTMIFKMNAEQLISSHLGTFLTNFTISLFCFIIVQFKPIIKLYKSILKFIEKIKNINFIVLWSIVICALCVFPVTIYYKVKFTYLLIFYSSMILTCFSIVIYSFKTQSKYNKVSDKYNVAINSLNDYENMMTKYRISNHENKNLLLTIRAMIINQEKDIPKYIDSIVDQKYKDDEKLLLDMAIIPSGGLRATIYSEILKIKDNKVNYSLIIDKNLKTVDLIELNTDTIVDICKIIGVFIDNAIEAVEKLKRKMIMIELYLENNNLNIKVTNNYKRNIDIERIHDEGYTTKSGNHGYGLSLVRKIILSNDIFENNTNISKNTFSQTLIIKYKKVKNKKTR